MDAPYEEANEQLLRAMEAAEVARAEVDADFPLLHAHSLLGVWGALESLVEDVVAAWLTHRRSLLDDGEFASVRVPLGTFQKMTVAERVQFLIDQVPRPTGVGGGFPRFEMLLDRVGLSGPVEDDLRRKLIEVHQVRNLYAHRRGIADRKALAACPWKKKDWKLGQQVRVGQDQYTLYVRAVVEYVVLLIARQGTKFNIDIHVGSEERAERVRKEQEAARMAERKRRLAAAKRRMRRRQARDARAEQEPGGGPPLAKQ